MGKKRAHRSSSSTSTNANSGSGTSSSNNAPSQILTPQHNATGISVGNSGSHPSNLRSGGNVSSSGPTAIVNSGSNGNMNVTLNMGGHPFSPAMMRELLAPGGPLAQVAANAPAGVVSSGSITFNASGGSVTVSQGGNGDSSNTNTRNSGGKNISGSSGNNNGGGNMSQDDAMAAQRYLQSLSQVLASHLNSSGGGSAGGGGNSNNSGNNNNSNSSGGRAVFGPMPPPPPPSVSSSTSNVGNSTSSGKGPVMGVSATISGGNGNTATFDLDAASFQSLGLGLEALSSSFLAQSQQSNSSSGSAGKQQRNTSSSSSSNNSGKMDINLANFQHVLNSMAAASAASSGGGGNSSNSKSSSQQNNNANNSNANNNHFQSKINTTLNSGDPEELKAMTSLFMELMGMTNNAGQESGDAQKADALGMAFYERLMKESAAMGGGGGSSSSGAPSMSSVMGAAVGAMSGMTPQQLRAEHDALRTAAFTAGVNVAIQQQQQQEKIHQQERQERQQASGKSKNKSSSGGNNSNVPVFSVLFGGNNNGGHSPTPLPAGAVPPLPPPPGGWPPGASAAAAAAAAAAFASSITNSDVSSGTSSSYQTNTNNTPLSDFPISAPDVGSAAWLDYYDACLRAGVVAAGNSESDEHARMASMAAGSSGGGGNNNGSIPQDRPAPNTSSKQRGRANADCDDDDGPEGFEYDDRGNRKNSEEEAEDGPPTEDECEDDNEELDEEQRRQLEAEEEEKRSKKAAKKRDKKARKKERAKKESEAKAALASLKKREKTITSWRSRVVAACIGGDASKMDLLIGESPYRNFVFDPAMYSLDDDNADSSADDQPQTEEEYLSRQLDWFLPNCLQKYQNQGSGSTLLLDNIARERLAKYIMSISFDVFYLPGPSQVQSALHSAAYNNDTNFVRWVIESQKEIAKSKPGDKKLVKDYLETLCYDGGWTPLHYAIASGSEPVVELLLEGGCNVHTRSDPNLMSFVSTGDGITSRELASYLQCENEDDELTCNGDILDEVLENRIFGASPTDRDAYMEVLSILQERLEDVEQNGYSPPRNAERGKVATSKESTAKIVGRNEQNQSSTGKKSKKKKKKQAPAPNPTPAPTPVTDAKSTLKASSSSDDELTDPVAVALLGMGFTADQIKSAAEALGGFERATADDMVMWILSGGELENNDEQNNPEEDRDGKDDHDTNNSSNVFLTKEQKKAAARAQREAEEAARKHQEEIAAAHRAAAKREEQRRIRREWNEKEEARQQEEKNAKIVEALEKQRQAELEKLKAEMPLKTALPVIPPAAQVAAGKGPPRTIIAGQKSGGTNAASVISSMGIPKAPVVKSPTILMRPGNVPHGALSSLNSQSVSNQPLFPQPMAPNLASAAPAAYPAHAKQKKHNKAHSTNPPAPRVNSTQYNPPMQTHQAASFVHKGAARNSQVVQQEYQPVETPGFGYGGGFNKDETSLSGGLGRNAGSIPPPGFRPGAPAPAAFSEPAAYIDTNPMGQIRATAREFVPTSFQPPPEPAPSSSGLGSAAVPSMSAQSAVESDSLTHSSPNDQMPTSSLLDPMSALLIGSTQPTRASTPGMKGDSPVPSAASSITGLSGLVEETMTSRVGSVMTFESAPAEAGFQGSSILDSIGGIWGGSATQESALGSTNIGGLAGLNFSSFLGEQNNSDSGNNDGYGKDRAGNTWGTSSDGFGAGAGRSIW